MPDKEKVISNLNGVHEYLRHFENTAKMGEWVADALALLKEQEAVSSEALKAHYGKMYKCKGCGLEWYQQTQRYCQHCGKAVRWDG